MPREKGNAQLLLDGIPDLNAQQLPLWLAKTCAHLLRGFVTGGTEFCQLQENSGFPPKYKFGEGKKKKKDKDTKTQCCRLEHIVPVDTREDGLWLHVTPLAFTIPIPTSSRLSADKLMLGLLLF